MPHLNGTCYARHLVVAGELAPFLAERSSAVSLCYDNHTGEADKDLRIDINQLICPTVRNTAYLSM